MNGYEIDLLKKLKSQQYSVSISQNLHDRITKHLLILKKLCRQGQTKQNWLMEAIRERLEFEENNKECEFQERRITLQVDLLTEERLSHRVSYIKQFRSSYSKKKWILDAIEEKLEKEKPMAEQKLAEYRDLVEKN